MMDYFEPIYKNDQKIFFGVEVGASVNLDARWTQKMMSNLNKILHEAFIYQTSSFDTGDKNIPTKLNFRGLCVHPIVQVYIGHDHMSSTLHNQALTQGLISMVT